MELVRLVGGLAVGVAGEELRHRHLIGAGDALAQLPEDVVGEVAGAVDKLRHRGHAMLQRLVGADGPPEGDTLVHVIDRLPHQGVGGAGHLGRQTGLAPIQRRPELVPTTAGLAQQLCRRHPHVIEPDLRQQIAAEHAIPADIDAGQCDVYDEVGQPALGRRRLVGAGRHQQVGGRGRVLDEHLGAIDDVGVPVALSGRLHALGAALAVALVQGEGEEHLPGGDALKILLLLLLRPVAGDGLRGDGQRGQLRARHQDAARLLEEEAEVEERAAGPTVRLRDAQAQEADIGELLPELRRVAKIGLLGLADERLRALSLQELANARLEQRLAFIEVEINRHGISSVSSLPCRDSAAPAACEAPQSCRRRC